MRHVIFLALFFGALVFAGAVHADTTSAYQFSDPVLEKRFKSLTKELRCPKCQNQSIADSDALQAGDLRRQIYQMLHENKADKEIVDFMVYRYGDFVLYRPQINNKTYLLWFGPLMLFLIGAVVVVTIVRSRSTIKSKEPLNAAQQEQLNSLLNKDKE